MEGSIPVITVRIADADHTLYFGYKAIQIFTVKLFDEALRLGGGKRVVKEHEIDRFKLFTFCIYGAMVNQAERIEAQEPTYQQAYDLTDAILAIDEEVQKSIWAVFENSRAGKILRDRLIEKKNTLEEAESQ